MKKNFKLLAICLTVLFLLPTFVVQAADNSFGKPPISIGFSSNPITIDGIADETDWANTANMASIIDNTRTGGVWVAGQPSGCATVDTLKFLWDANFIYVLIKVNDSTISAPDTSAYNNDGVEYFIDTLNDKTKTAYNGVYTAQYRKERSGAVSGWGSYSNANFTINSSCVSTDTGYTQEVKIAGADHGPTTFAAGTSIGFDIQINDAKDGARTWQIVWNSKDVGWTDPSSFGTLDLSASLVTPEPTATPVPTATPISTATPTPPIVGAVTIKLDKTSATLRIPQTLQLKATVSIPYIASHSVKWTTSNKKVATVSSTGKVKSIAPGIANITATSVTGSKKATCKVTVVQPVTSLKLNLTKLTLSAGKTKKLIVTILPSNASNKKVAWKSANKTIATVTAAGIVKGIKKGSTVITVTSLDSKKTAKCTLTVK